MGLAAAWVLMAWGDRACVVGAGAVPKGVVGHLVEGLPLGKALAHWARQALAGWDGGGGGDVALGHPSLPLEVVLQMDGMGVAAVACLAGARLWSCCDPAWACPCTQADHLEGQGPEVQLSWAC